MYLPNPSATDVTQNQFLNGSKAALCSKFAFSKICGLTKAMAQSAGAVGYNDRISAER